MGRASRSKGGSKSGSSTKKSKQSRIKDLVEAAEECCSRLEYEEALQHYENALKINPEETTILDAAGEILLELGQVEQAREVLTRSVQLNPRGSFCSYMYLGQLCQGVDAVSCYDRGIGLLRAELESATGDDALLLQAKLSESLSSKAELYMTDLCDHPEAESKCQEALEAALQVDPSNVDALLTAANLFCVLQNREQAIAHLDRAAAVLEALGDENRPPPHVCMTCAKLYVELEEHEKAAEQLEEILADDDTLTEAHFMLAAEYQALGDKQSAQESCQQAHVLHQRDEEPCPIIMKKILDLAAALQ